jgi:hypothetical protein
LAFALLTACSLAAPVLAATARDELLRLVPDDVGFCLVLQDLRSHSKALLASPFAEQFRASPIGQALCNAPEGRKLVEMDRQFQNHLGIDWARLRDDILGDCVVLAYRPGPPGKPDDEQGVLLLRARDPKLLAELLDRLNQVQKQSGDLKELQARKHGGRDYVGRFERKETRFYYLNGPVLAVSSQEELLHRVMDLGAAASRETESPLARQLRRLGALDGLATLWINPRAFDAELKHKASQAGPAGEASFLQTFFGYWKVLQGIALTASLNQTDFELRLDLAADEGALRGPARKLFGEAGRPSELWGRFPENAILAVAGTLDAMALTDLVGEFMTPEARKAVREAVDRGAGATLGRDVAKDVLPNLGPDWGLCVAAPPPAEKAWFPHLLWALRVRPGDKDKPLDRALLEVLNSFALLGVFGYNNSHPDQLTIRAVMQDQVEVRYLTGDRGLPPGLQPAFALKDGYLLLASSPEAIRRFGAAAKPAPSPADESPLLRLSFQELTRFLNTRKEVLIPAMAEKDHVSAEEAGRRLERLVLSLQLFDRLQLSRHLSQGRLTFVFRLKSSQPLR